MTLGDLAFSQQEIQMFMPNIWGNRDTILKLEGTSNFENHLQFILLVYQSVKEVWEF